MNKKAKFWRKWLSEGLSKYDKINLTKQRYEVIKKHVKGNKILDFGSGTGYMINRLSKNNYDCYAIDFYKSKTISENVKFFKINSIKDLRKIKIEKIDTIIVSEVLEHLKISEIKTLLKFFRKIVWKRSRIIVTVPYKENLSESKILCPYCLKWFHPWLHIQSFDEEKLYKIFKKFNFEIEKIKYITPFDFGKLKILFFLKYLVNIKIWILATFKPSP